MCILYVIFIVNFSTVMRINLCLRYFIPDEVEWTDVLNMDVAKLNATRKGWWSDDGLVNPSTVFTHDM